MVSLLDDPRAYSVSRLIAPGAVDMDVYGAFQLCAIGVLAAPVTVRLSRTYFEDPGRNTIFVWSTIVLAGAFEDSAGEHAANQL